MSKLTPEGVPPEKCGPPSSQISLLTPSATCAGLRQGGQPPSVARNSFRYRVCGPPFIGGDARPTSYRPALSVLLLRLSTAEHGGPMDHSDVERLRDRHPAWRLLRAANAPLILAFLGRYFVVSNHGATSISDLAVALDDELYALNSADP